MNGNASNSDFGSEDEDAEFALYAQLYFEPNEDLNRKASLSEGTKVKGPINDVLSNDVDPNRQKALPSVQGERTNNQRFINVEINSNSDLLATSTNSQSKSKIVSNPNWQKALPSLQEKRTKNQVFPNVEVHPKSSSLENKIRNESGPNSKKQRFSYVVTSSNSEIKSKEYGPLKSQPPQKRKRSDSVCSVDSISGKVPLDDLYCNVLDSLDEEDEEGEGFAENMLPIESSDDDSRCKTLEKINYKVGNRPKRVKLNDSDSRCKIEKKAINQLKKKKKKLSSANSDSLKREKTNIRKTVEIVCIDSDSDSSENSIEVTCIDPETERTEAQGKDRDDAQSQPATSKKRILENSGDTCTLESDIPSMNETVVISTSDTDSDDDDILQGINDGPKLIMNFDNAMPFIDAGPNATMNFDNANLELGAPTHRESNEVSLYSKWTPEMFKFYNSRNFEILDIAEVHSRQSDHSKDWKILSRDTFINKRRRYFNEEPRCKRCRQFGHKVEQCPRFPHCYLCASADHVGRYRCPENLCFRCGGKPHQFCSYRVINNICLTCQKRGHVDNACPDLWRRYHVTTSGSVPVPVQLKPVRKRRVRYCCSCGKKGHYGFECRYQLSHTSYGSISIEKYRIMDRSIYNYTEPVFADGRLIQNEEEVSIVADDVEALDTHENSIIDDDVEAVDTCETSIQDILGSNLTDPSSTVDRLFGSRQRDAVISVVRKKVSSYKLLRKRLHELASAVEVLKQAQRQYEKLYLLPLTFIQNLEKSLKLVSHIVVGHLKLGKGKGIHNRISRNLNKLQRLNKNARVPVHELRKFSNNFAKIDAPHLVQLSELIYLAETYLESQGKQCSTRNIKVSSESNKEFEGCEVIGVFHGDDIKPKDFVNNESTLLQESEKCDVPSSYSNEDSNNSPLEKTKFVKSETLPELGKLKASLLVNSSKKNVVSVLKSRLALDEKLNDRLRVLKSKLKVLRIGKRLKDQGKTFPSEFVAQFNASLKLVSVLIVGHLKYGEGGDISSNLAQILSKVLKLSNNAMVPKDLIKDILGNFDKVDNPSIDQLDEMLLLARKYLRKQKKENKKRINLENKLANVTGKAKRKRKRANKRKIYQEKNKLAPNDNFEPELAKDG